MDANTIIDGLLYYVGLVVLLTFHEFGHAWTAWRCGDDTARLQGRVSLNPLVHIDPVGTVLLPLVMIFAPFGLSRFLVGWAKPVPVNPYNLGHPKRDDILVTMAGPGMNLALAVVLVALARAALVFNAVDLAGLFHEWAGLSLMLCFFNLIPIPPLDGSHIMRIVTNMTYETYANLARFGFIAIIILLQFQFVRTILGAATFGTRDLLERLFGVS
jgi:Zn-dependent protease